MISKWLLRCYNKSGKGSVLVVINMKCKLCLNEKSLNKQLFLLRFLTTFEMTIHIGAFRDLS